MRAKVSALLVLAALAGTAWAQSPPTEATVVAHVAEAKRLAGSDLTAKVKSGVRPW